MLPSLSHCFTFPACSLNNQFCSSAMAAALSRATPGTQHPQGAIPLSSPCRRWRQYYSSFVCSKNTERPLGYLYCRECWPCQPESFRNPVAFQFLSLISARGSLWSCGLCRLCCSIMCCISGTVRVLLCSGLFTDVLLSQGWAMNEEPGIVASF